MRYKVFWKNPCYVPRHELRKNITGDYLIVDGGISSVSLAYFLANLGAKNIVLIEKNTIASGAIGNAAGSLVASGEIDLNDLVRQQGLKKSTQHRKLLRQPSSP